MNAEGTSMINTSRRFRALHNLVQERLPGRVLSFSFGVHSLRADLACPHSFGCVKRVIPWAELDGVLSDPVEMAVRHMIDELHEKIASPGEADR
jgi:hypothetical protein